MFPGLTDEDQATRHRRRSRRRADGTWRPRRDRRAVTGSLVAGRPARAARRADRAGRDGPKPPARAGWRVGCPARARSPIPWREALAAAADGPVRQAFAEPMAHAGRGGPRRGGHRRTDDDATCRWPWPRSSAASPSSSRSRWPRRRRSRPDGRRAVRAAAPPVQVGHIERFNPGRPRARAAARGWLAVDGLRHHRVDVRVRSRRASATSG